MNLTNTLLLVLLLLHVISTLVILLTLKRRWNSSSPVRLLKSRKTVIKDLLAGASRDVFILTTSLDSIKDDLHELKTKALSSQHFRVRVLTLNPNHSFTSDRCTDFDKSPEAFRSEMFDAIRDCHNICKDVERFELRIHSRFPTGMIFLIDNDLVLGFVLHHREKNTSARGRHKPHIVIPSREMAANSFQIHLETLWDDSITVETELIDRLETEPTDANDAGKRLKGISVDILDE